MKFELISTRYTYEVSRKAFVGMLSGAMEISKNYTTWNSVNGYTGKNKKYWFFLDLEIKFNVYYDTLEELKELMEELKK